MHKSHDSLECCVSQGTPSIKCGQCEQQLTFLHSSTGKANKCPVHCVSDCRRRRQIFLEEREVLGYKVKKIFENEVGTPLDNEIIASTEPVHFGRTTWSKHHINKSADEVA